MNQYLLEYMGSLVICFTIVFSHENPLLVGIAHTMVLYLADISEIKGHFTTFGVISDLLLNRLEYIEAVKITIIQLLAIGSIVLIYQTKTLM